MCLCGLVILPLGIKGKKYWPLSLSKLPIPDLHHPAIASSLVPSTFRSSKDPSAVCSPQFLMLITGSSPAPHQPHRPLSICYTSPFRRGAFCHQYVQFSFSFIFMDSYYVSLCCHQPMLHM